MEITKESFIKMIERPFHIVNYNDIKDHIEKFGYLIDKIEINPVNDYNLNNFTNLKLLKITDTPNRNKIISLENLPVTLETLILDHCNIKDFTFLEKLNNLKKLCIFTNLCLKSDISSVTLPKTLNIIKFYQISSVKNYDFIKNLDNLEYVEIDKPCNDLLSKNIKKLNINFGIPLNYLDNLDVLKIKNSKINEDFIKNLPINLKDLYLIDCVFEGTVFDLEYMNNLTVLHMIRMNLYKEEIIVKLPNNIKELNLTETYLHTYDFLEKLPNLIKLFIDVNDVDTFKNLKLKNINYTDLEYMNGVYDGYDDVGSKYFQESYSYVF